MTRLTHPLVRRIKTARLDLIIRLSPEGVISLKEFRRHKWFSVPLQHVWLTANELWLAAASKRIQELRAQGWSRARAKKKVWREM